jgi:hypothetical protein
MHFAYELRARRVCPLLWYEHRVAKQTPGGPSSHDNLLLKDTVTSYYGLELPLQAPKDSYSGHMNIFHLHLSSFVAFLLSSNDAG